MYYKELDMPGNTRNTVNTFLGYNHSSRTGNGEFYNMENISSDEYPLMSPRKKRKNILTLKNREWIDMKAQITAAFDSEVSEVHLTYKTERMELGEKETINVEFTADYQLVENVKIFVKCYAAETLNGIEERIPESGHDNMIVLPEKTDSFEVEIGADMIAPEIFEQDMMDRIVSDITVKQLNRNIRGMLLKGGRLAYMIGSKIYFDNAVYDFKEYIPQDDDYRTEQQLLSFGAYILVFPLGLYVNTVKPEDYGYLGAGYYAGAHESKVVFTMADASGKEIMTSDVKPNTPKNGDYWLDTSETGKGLYRWSDSMSMWVSISATYIRISMDFTDVPETPFPQMFKEGDAVFMNSEIQNINDGSVIVKQGNTKDADGNITGGYIVVKGFLDGKRERVVSADNPMYFKRKIPDLDYVCVSNNRVWGCRHGRTKDNDVLNEIYASKLGDAKNWYCFDGAATDSYTLSLGEDSEFTGAFCYQGYPMFFKENTVYKIYGNYPATYQLYTYDCRGVQKGSFRSLAVVNEYLVYKSVNDICVFDGSTPTGISQALGNRHYARAAAGACLGKYYISMMDEEGTYELFVYDMEHGIWCREDNLKLEEFAYNANGELYGRNKIAVYGFGEAENILGQIQEYGEPQVRWMAETGDLGMDDVEKKYIKKIHIRAYMPYHSSIDVHVQCDRRGWKKISSLRGNDTIQVHSIPISPQRGDSFRIKMEGYGECRIYMMSWEMEGGSDKK